MSKAHMEAVNFVEEHSNKLLEEKINELIERTAHGLEGTEQMISDIS